MIASGPREQLASLFASASLGALSGLRRRIGQSRDMALSHGACEGRDRFIALCEALDAIVAASIDSRAGSTDGGHGADVDRGSDHDYGHFFKLARSVTFSWGARLTSSAAMSPQIWALNEIFANTAPADTMNVLEIGCGTGAFGYELKLARPNARVTQMEASLESLVLAILLQAGTALSFPRRVAFELADDGVDWFDLQAPPVSDGIDHSLATLDDLSGDRDWVVAVNCLSLFDDPRAAVRDAIGKLKPTGRFLWLDLVSWRAETPQARRLRGLPDMIGTVRDAGMTVYRSVPKIPYVEDWGFERSYNWESHAVFARFPDA